MLVVSDLRKNIVLSGEITVILKCFVLEAKYSRPVRVPSNVLSFLLKTFHFFPSCGVGNIPSGDTLYYSVSSEKCLQLNKMETKATPLLKEGILSYGQLILLKSASCKNPAFLN